MFFGCMRKGLKGKARRQLRHGLTRRGLETESPLVRPKPNEITCYKLAKIDINNLFLLELCL